MSRRSMFPKRWGHKPVLDKNGLLPGEADRVHPNAVRAARYRQQAQAIRNALALGKLPPAKFTYDFVCRMMAVNPQGFRVQSMKKGRDLPINWMADLLRSETAAVAS